MGMTNRVIPAQGEERGASFTLIRLDGDASRKFQPSQQQFQWQFLQSSSGQSIRPSMLSMGRILPQTAQICMFSCWGVRLAVRAAFPRSPPDGTATMQGSAFESVRFVPVAPNSHIDFEGHRQRRRSRHVAT